MRRRRFLSLAAVGSPLLVTTCLKRSSSRPPGVATDRVTLRSELANRYVKANAPAEMLARIRIGTRSGAQIERPAANVALVMDTSASMRGDPIEQARTAALALLDSLRDNDILSVVVFGSRPEVIVPSTVLEPNVRAAIIDKIAAIEARGSTDLAGGLQAGLDELARRLDPGVPRLNRVVLLSDGVPNDPSPIAGLAGTAAHYGAPITALGVGVEFHETLLARIAQISGGRFHFVEDARRVAALFEEEVLDMERTLARGLALSLQPGPGIGLLEVIGHAPSYAGRAATLTLGDLAEGQRHEIIVRLSVEDHVPGATIELLDVALHFVDALDPSGPSGEARDFLELQATEDDAQIAAARNETLERDALRAQAASVTLEAMRLARDGAVPQAHGELDRLEAEAIQDAAKDDDELRELLGNAKKLRETLPELSPAPSPSTPIEVHAAPRRMKAANAGAAALSNRTIHAAAYDALH